MCQCTPSIRTPYCNKFECRPPLTGILRLDTKDTRINAMKNIHRNEDLIKGLCDGDSALHIVNQYGRKQWTVLDMLCKAQILNENMDFLGWNR